MALFPLLWMGLRVLRGALLYGWSLVEWAIVVAAGSSFMLTDVAHGYGWGAFVLLTSAFSLVAFRYSHQLEFMPWAREVTEDRNQYLLNVASEQAQFAGLPVPGVIESHLFTASAVGPSSRDAILCISPTLQCTLDRRELGAMLSHEMAHMKNRDALLGTLLMVVIGGVVALSISFRAKCVVKGGGISQIHRLTASWETAGAMAG